MTSSNIARTVAVIGSFKQHNADVQKACSELRDAGIEVTSPKGSEIVEGGISFVRFSSDDEAWSDPEIQSLALHRILRADAVYVVSPMGYIGRTTCYEVGRVIQHRSPIYFSCQPLDLPVRVPSDFIVSIAVLIERMKHPFWKPQWLFEIETANDAVLERSLLDGIFRND